MTDAKTPEAEGVSRELIDLRRKVEEMANAMVGGDRFVTGDIIPHFAPTRPGAVLADGTIYLDTDTTIGPDLAALLRSLGFFTDGTHVQVPDYRGYAIGGVGGALGSLGVPIGISAVTLTDQQSGLRQHTHLVTDPGHVHVTSLPQAIAQGTAAGNSINAGTLISTQSAVTGISIQNVAAANAAQSHTNIQPTLPVYIFIKT